MKTIKFLLISLLSVFFFHNQAFAVASVNPALSGLEKLYVILEPATDRSGSDGLIWLDLQGKVEKRIKEAGIKIQPGIVLGKGPRDKNIAELRVVLGLRKLENVDLYIFNVQLTLAKKALIEKQNLKFKAVVWSSNPYLTAENIKDMPDVLTATIMNHVENFINAHYLANKYTNDKTTSNRSIKDKPDSKLVTTITRTEYISSKNSRIFHKADCPAGKRILKENLITYKSREHVVKAGKRACKRCNP